MYERCVPLSLYEYLDSVLGLSAVKTQTSSTDVKEMEQHSMEADSVNLEIRVLNDSKKNYSVLTDSIRSRGPKYSCDTEEVYMYTPRRCIRRRGI